MRTAPAVAYPRLVPTGPGAVWVPFGPVGTHVPQAVTLPYITTATHVRELRVTRLVTHAPELPIVQYSHELRIVPGVPHIH